MQYFLVSKFPHFFYLILSSDFLFLLLLITTSSQIFLLLSPLPPLSMCMYLRLLEPCLDIRCFSSFLLDGERNSVYGTFHGVEGLSAVDGWVKR